MPPLLRGRTSLIEPCVVAEGKILLEICGAVHDCTMGQRWINLIGQRWINFIPCCDLMLLYPLALNFANGNDGK